MASKTKAQERMDALKGSGARQVLMEFLQERLRDHENKFVTLSKETFDVHKGRCIEIRDIIKYLES